MEGDIAPLVFWRRSPYRKGNDLMKTPHGKPDRHGKQTENPSGESSESHLDRSRDPDAVPLSPQADRPLPPPQKLMTAKVKTALRHIPDVRIEKVQALKSSVEDGSYHVDSEGVARRMVDESLRESAYMIHRKSRHKGNGDMEPDDAAD